MSRTNSQIGAALLPPAAAAAGVSLIGKCDPPLDALKTAFQTVLNSKLNTAWRAAAQTFGNEYGNNVVNEAQVLGVPELIEQARLTWKWPALALWRLRDKYQPRTLVYDECESEVVCVYAMPPMTLEFAQRLGHIRKAVVNTLRQLIEEQGDASLLSGANFLSAAGIEELTLTEATYGEVFQSADMQQTHPGVEMMLMLKEREMPVTTGMSDTTRINGQIDLVDSTNLTNVVEVQDDPRT